VHARESGENLEVKRSGTSHLEPAPGAYYLTFLHFRINKDWTSNCTTFFMMMTFLLGYKDVVSRRRCFTLNSQVHSLYAVPMQSWLFGLRSAHGLAEQRISLSTRPLVSIPKLSHQLQGQYERVNSNLTGFGPGHTCNHGNCYLGARGAVSRLSSI
jgi:hypothetical protein